MNSQLLFLTMNLAFLPTPLRADVPVRYLQAFKKAKVPLLKEIRYSTWELGKQIAPAKVKLDAGPNAKISFEEVEIQKVFVPPGEGSPTPDHGNPGRSVLPGTRGSAPFPCWPPASI